MGVKELGVLAGKLLPGIIMSGRPHLWMLRRWNY